MKSDVAATPKRANWRQRSLSLAVSSLYAEYRAWRFDMPDQETHHQLVNHSGCGTTSTIQPPHPQLHRLPAQLLRRAPEKWLKSFPVAETTSAIISPQCVR
jgi:hypothetical protein